MRGQVGDLKWRITLQAPTQVKDALGTPSVAYIDVATVWAKKTTHRSNEAVQAMAQTGQAVHNYRIRYRTDIKSSWKIKDGNKVMAIIGPPMEVERRTWMDLTVREVA